MKRVLFFAVAMLVISPVLMAKKKMPPAKETGEIHWITSIDELQAKMAKEPKKVYVDIYTGWCGWCKKMDASTFQNPDVIKYINLNFYAVRLDAERQDEIHFMGKEYHFDPQYKANTFAVELMLGANKQGQMSYPTSVFMLENFQSPTPVPGYHDIKEMEVLLTFFGDNAYKHQQWPDYQKTYKASWDHGVAPDMTPPAGH
jgi:thioredoxin-related protein